MLQRMKKISASIIFIVMIATPKFFAGESGGYSVETNSKPGQYPREYRVLYRFSEGSRVLGIGLTNVEFGHVSILLDLVSVSGNNAVVHVRSFEITNFAIPPLPARVTEGNRTNTVLTPEVLIEQTNLGLAVSNRAPIEDIFPVSDPTVPVMILLSLLLLGAGGLLVYRLFFMKQKPRLKLDAGIDPYEEALKNLNRLRQTEWNDKNAKDIFLGIWETVRRFLDRVLGFPALEMSTSEIAAHFRKTPAEGLEEVQDIAMHVLKVCDRVKYAKYRPELEQKDGVLSESYELVRRVREHFEAMKAASEMEAKGGQS